MKWDVNITKEGLEIDEYDLPETVYILARDDKNRVSGVWRMLPSSSPSMIRDIWPEFLESFPIPINDYSWEVSRFGVHTFCDDPKTHLRQVNKITAELITGLLTVCNMTGIKDIYTMYNPQVGRSVRKIGFIADATSQELPVDGKASIVGRFKMNQEAISRVKGITGIQYDLNPNDLPPILRERFQKQNSTFKEVVHA